MDDKPKFDVTGYLSFVIALIPIVVAIFDRGGPGKYGVFSDVIAILVFSMPFIAIVFGIGGLMRSVINVRKFKANGILISGMIFSILGIIGGIIWIVFFMMIIRFFLIWR